MKWIKRIFFILFVLIMLVLIGLGIFLLSFDLNHYRDSVTTRLSDALGYPVKIQKMSTKISFIPTINVSGVLVLDKDQKTIIAQVPQVEAVLELSPLVYGQISVQKIAIPKADFFWKKGQKQAVQKNAPKEKNSHLAKLWIETIIIDKLRCQIEYDKTYNFEANNIKIKDLSRISLDTTFSGQKINLSANLGSILEITHRRDLPVNLALKRNKDSLTLTGRIGDLENFYNMHFQLDAMIADLSEFSTTFKTGFALPKLPLKAKLTFEGNLEKAEFRMPSLTIGENDLSLEFEGTLNQLNKNPFAKLEANLSVQNGEFAKFFEIKPLESSFLVDLTKNKVTFSDIKLMANKSDGKGQLSFEWGKTPFYVNGNFTSTYFNIYDVWNPQKKLSKETQKARKNTSFFTSEKLPFDVLNKINTDIKLNVTNLHLSKDLFDYLKLESNIIIKNGELDAPFQIGIFDGSIKSRLKINTSKNTVSFLASASDIQLSKIKPINQSIKDSLAYANISLQGRGNSLRQLADTMSGKIELELTNGQIVNKWFNSLPSTLNLLKGNSSALSFSTQDQKTALICGALNLNFKDGIARSNNQIALETEILNFVVNGQINLKKETLDISVVPFVNQAKGLTNDLLSATQAVYLKGPWNKIEAKVASGKAVENIIKSITQKPNNQTASPLGSKTLCQRALGHPVTQPQRTNKVNPNNNTKAAKNPAQEQSGLKEKLLQSLSQALAGQQ